MRTGAQWYQRRPQAYLGGVQGLPAKLHAVYSVVLDLIYMHGGSINNDPRWISGWIGDMGSAAVRRAIDDLSKMGKLIVTDVEVTEKHAKSEAKTSKELSETRAKAGKKGGENSANLRAEENKNKDLSEANASKKNRADKIREDKNISSSSPSAHEEQGLAESIAPQSVDDDMTNLYERVMAAAGLQVGTIPTYWMPPAAIYHVARWRDLGLFDDEIVEIARNQRRNHAEPPSGPKAFDRAMQICSSTKSLPKLESIQQTGQSYGRSSGSPHPNHERLRRIAEAAIKGTT